MKDLVKLLKVHAARNRAPITQLRDVEISPTLREMIAATNAVNGKLSLISLIQPTNLKVVEGWFRENYDSMAECPLKFEYEEAALKEASEQRATLLEIEMRLKSFTAAGYEESVLAKMLERRIRSLTAVTEIAEEMLGRNEAAVAQKMRERYPVPDMPLIKAAHDVLTEAKQPRIHEDCWLTHRKVEAEHLAKIFRKALETYGFTDWLVEVTAERKNISVRYETPDGKPRIYVPADRNVNGVEAVRLTAHEIECHVLDTMNARAILHGMPKVDNDLLYEGRAILSDVQVEQKYMGYSQILILKAVLVLAIDTAANCEAAFAEIGRRATEEFAECGLPEATALDEGFKVAYRIFRGGRVLSENTGCIFPKDAVYLAGYQLAQELCRDGLLDYLRVGASTVEDLSELAAYYQVTPNDLPYRYLDFGSQLAIHL